jgi:glyoxylase-like metal-dependent hydrolase (beta-lactamase superfamily II)
MFIIIFLSLLFSLAQATEMSLIQVGEQSFYVEGVAGEMSEANEGFTSNAGFVITDDGVVVFDTLGTPALARALIAEIQKKTDQPIRKVIISHFHPDHFYGIKAFKDLGAVIYAHESARDILTRPGTIQRFNQIKAHFPAAETQDWALLAADEWFGESWEFSQGGKTFLVKHLGPAHTKEDSVLWVPEEGVLFVADLLFTNRLPFVGNGDPTELPRAIDEILTFPARIVVPGHGQALPPAQAVALTRDYSEVLLAGMQAGVDNLQNFSEAYEAVDWSAFESIAMFDSLNRINANFTFLLLEARNLQ